MQMCLPHWALLRKLVEESPVSVLVRASGKESADAVMENAKDQEHPFDPLMDLNLYWCKQALANGGLGVMADNPDAENKQYCPLCLYEKHAKDFNAEAVNRDIVGTMTTHARQKGWIPNAQ